MHFSVTSGGVYDSSFIASGIPVNEPKFLDTYQSTFLSDRQCVRIRSLSEQVDLTYAVAVYGKTGAFGMAQHIIISVGLQPAYLVCTSCGHSLLFVNAGLRCGKQSRVLYLSAEFVIVPDLEVSTALSAG